MQRKLCWLCIAVAIAQAEHDLCRTTCDVSGTRDGADQEVAPLSQQVNVGRQPTVQDIVHGIVYTYKRLSKAFPGIMMLAA